MKIIELKLKMDFTKAACAWVSILYTLLLSNAAVNSASWQQHGAESGPKNEPA